MKKTLKILLSLMLIFALCFGLAACAPAEPEVVQVEQPEPKAEPVIVEEEPEVEMCSVCIPDVQIFYTVLDRDTEVSVTGEEGEYYTIDIDGVSAYIEKRFVRLVTEEPFTPYEGTVSGDVSVYPTAYLEGESTGMLAEDTAVTVNDEFGGVKFVSSDTLRGYIDGNVSVVTEEQKSKKNEKSSGSGKKTSKSDGSSSESKGESSTSDTPSGGGNEGQDDQPYEDGDPLIITLSQIQNNENLGLVLLSSEIVSEENGTTENTVTFPASGTVLTDGAETYLGFTAEGTEYVLSGEEDGFAIIDYSEGIIGKVPFWSVIKQEANGYESREAYATSDMQGYTEYKLRYPGMIVPEKAKVTVLYENDDFYVLRTEDGNIVYVIKTEENSGWLSDEMPVAEEETEEKSSGNSEKKSSKKKSSGSSKSSGSQPVEPAQAPVEEPQISEPTTEWTDFEL